jgi:hypothetical protein
LAGNFAGEARITFEAIAKALIGDVNEWNCAIGREGRDDLIFLLFAEVRSGWVVAAAVQQDDIAGGNGFDICQHGVKIHITLFAHQNSDIRTGACQDISRFEGWLGQVGLDSQTVAPGEAIFTSSSA